jgi:hypothetical protein
VAVTYARFGVAVFESTPMPLPSLFAAGRKIFFQANSAEFYWQNSFKWGKNALELGKCVLHLGKSGPWGPVYLCCHKYPP